MGRIDIGNEIEPEIALGIRGEREIGHYGAEVATADTDINDVAHALSGKSPPLALADAVGKITHAGENFTDAGHDILSVDKHLRGRIAIAQSSMQHRAILGRVDLGARKHLFDLVLKPGRFGDFHKRLHRLAVDAVFRIIEKPPGSGKRKLVRATRIFREKLLDRFRARGAHRLVKIFPFVFH